MYCKLFQCLGTCISSKQFKSLNAEAEKYCHTVHNFKINGTRTKGSSSRVAVFSDIVQCAMPFVQMQVRLAVDELTL